MSEGAEFRQAVLRRRREGATMAEIAEEIPTSRATLYRMFRGESIRSKATEEAAERFVASQLTRSEENPPPG